MGVGQTSASQFLASRTRGKPTYEEEAEEEELEAELQFTAA